MQSDRRSDKELWRLISQKDDRSAFEQLYRNTLHALMASIYRWSDDAAEAEAFREEELVSREALVSSELAQLPAQMKKVYLLSAEQGKSIREISEELLVSPFTVKNHLQKIRKRLRSAALRMTSSF